MNTLIVVSIMAFLFLGVQCTVQRIRYNQQFIRKYNYEVKYFSTLLDHFSFTEVKMFNLKYLINKQYWKPGGPIFFYTGNEGSIELFAENTGFIWDISPEFNAVVVFAEHRYYGDSLPFGNDSFNNPAHFGYFTVEQALADYVKLITHLKYKTDFKDAPVIAFGGSYGGMLAAWIRQKYPNVIAGSIAASAPVWNLVDLVPCEGFSKVLTDAYRRTGSNYCVKNIRRMWSVLSDYGKSSQGLKTISRIFKTCQVLERSSDLSNFINSALGMIGMANYPYPADFLGHMPAWPVKEFCKPLNNASLSNITLMSGVAKAIQIYTNYTGKLSCLNLSNASPPSLDDKGWNIQWCLEIMMPSCTNGVTDMFPPQRFDLDAAINSCSRMLGVSPKPRWINLQYWGERLHAASNILFSNGDLDPWSAGGVTTNFSDSLPIVRIHNGAHHLDLRAADPQDTPEVKVARNIEKSFIRKWIKEWK